MSTKKSSYMPYLMWLFPMLFFTYQFILRLWPGLMMDVIMKQFLIDATSFGLLASVYYLGYAFMQIPIAILIDKYAPKYVLFSCTFVCGFATVIFSYTDSWPIAVLSRLLVGIGSAAGFLTVSKVISQWFPKNKYSYMVGLSFCFGLMGAVYGGRPINNLIESTGFLQVALTLGAVSVTIGLLALLFLKTKMTGKEKNLDNKMKLSDLTKIISTPAICILAASNFLMVGSLEGFADVWGLNYLVNAYQIDKGEAAGITSYVFIGMIVGGPILASLGKYFGNHCIIVFCGFGMMLISCLLFYSGLSYNYYLFAILFLIIGILCCYQILVFSVGNELVDAKLLGVTIAFLNSINMFGGSFFHTTIGHLMDVFWQGEFKEDGITRLYNAANYSYALAIIPICAVIGALMVIFVNIKYSSKNLQY